MLMVLMYFFAGIFLGVAQGQFNPGTLTPEDISRLLKYNTQCKKQSGVTTPELLNLVQGTFSDSQPLKDHIFCMATKLNLVAEDGSLVKDEISNKMAPLFQQDPEVFEDLLEQCYLQREKAMDTVYDTLKCFAGHINEE